jgi:hypothetical protein
MKAAFSSQLLAYSWGIVISDAIALGLSRLATKAKFATEQAKG